MPTKRRPLKHGPRVGDVRVTSRLLNLYRSFQDEVLAHGRYTRAAGQLNSALQMALGELPWADPDEEDLRRYQLWLLAYPDPKTRPKRIPKVSGHNPLIDAYERKRQAGLSVATQIATQTPRGSASCAGQKAEKLWISSDWRVQRNTRKTTVSALGDRGSGVQISPLRPLSTRRRNLRPTSAGRRGRADLPRHR